jgi:hypothetical protein
VNYATERWIGHGIRREPTDAELQKYSFEFEIDGKPKYLVGDANVYAWHRFQHTRANTVECALMALEKWLYDEIEKGNSISRWVHIYAQGESVGFAGLLVSIGLKYPALFTGELQPLLGNFYVYECQTSIAGIEGQDNWAISYGGEPEEAVRLAAEWHRMSHRQSLLRDAATVLMLEDEGTAKYLSVRKAEWAKLRQGDEKQRLDMEFFLARFDSGNYTKTPQDGWVLRWPDHLEKIAKQPRKKAEFISCLVTLAQHARRLLEGQQLLGVEDIPKFAGAPAKACKLEGFRRGSADRALSDQLHRWRACRFGHNAPQVAFSKSRYRAVVHDHFARVEAGRGQAILFANVDQRPWG